jgi:hypothetical protein
MKFGKATLLGVLLLASSSDAFSINPHKTAVQKALVSAQEATTVAQWRAPMNMVAGGAERAYGDDYYEGESVPNSGWDRFSGFLGSSTR